MVQGVSSFETGAKTAGPLRPQYGQGQWDRQVTSSPDGAFLRARKKYPFSAGEKRKTRCMALQVKSRLDFNSQSALQ